MRLAQPSQSSGDNDAPTERSDFDKLLQEVKDDLDRVSKQQQQDSAMRQAHEDATSSSQDANGTCARAASLIR